jgi:hypothetical protein
VYRALERIKAERGGAGDGGGSGSEGEGGSGSPNTVLAEEASPITTEGPTVQTGGGAAGR